MKPPPGSAPPDLAARVEELSSQLSTLLREVGALRAEVRELRAGAAPPAVPEGSRQAAVPPPVPIETVPAEAVSTDAVSTEAMPIEAVPIEAAPIEAAPIEASVSEAAPEEVPFEVSPPAAPLPGVEPAGPSSPAPEPVAEEEPGTAPDTSEVAVPQGVEVVEEEPVVRDAAFEAGGSGAGRTAAEPLGDTAPAAEPAEQPAMDLETRIGTVWFNRVGLVLMVVAFALLARVVAPQLQPWHRVVASYLGAALLYGVGWRWESRLKGFARPVMAGGLALAFFTSFAAHFIPPMACVPLGASLLLMFASAGAVLGRAETWRSEATAGFAVFLGFVAAYVGSSGTGVVSMTAVLFLSATALVLLLRHDWSPLSFFTVAAAFSFHMLWLLRAEATHASVGELWQNLIFLTGYYLTFVAADLVFYHRLAVRGLEAFTQRQRLAGRAVGPTVLVGYATVASVLFYKAGEVWWQKIDLFFYPLAAFQLVLLLYHRRKGNPDASFYGVTAAALFTLGLFASLGGLALNLALAAEALLLLLLARRIDFWILRPLAQGVLSVNFFHFWFSEASDLESWPTFVGAVVMAAVYLVKARIYETWSGIPEEQRFRAKKSVFQVFYDRYSLPIAHFQAMAGGLLLVYQCHKFLETPWSLLALGILVVVGTGAGLFLGSATVLQGIGFAALGCGLLAWIHALGPRPEVLPEGWPAQAAVAALAAAGLAALLKGRREPRRTYPRFATAALAAAVVAAGPAATLGTGGGVRYALVLLWTALLWAAVELWPVPTPAALAAGLAPRLVRFYRGAGWRRLLLSLAAAVLGVWATGWAFEDNRTAVLALCLLGLALLAAALVRSSALLALGLVVHQSLLVFGALFAVESGDLLRWGVPSAIALSSAALITACSRIGRGSFGLAALASGAQAVFLLGCLTLFPEETFQPVALWLVPVALLFAAMEVFRTGRCRCAETFSGWTDQRGGALFHQLASIPAGLGAVATSSVLGLVLQRAFEAPGQALWAMTAASVVLLAATLGRRSPYLLAALLTHLGQMTLHRLLHGDRLVEETLLEWVSVTVVAVAAAALLLAAPRQRRGTFAWGGLAALGLVQLALAELLANDRPGPASALWVVTFVVCWVAVESYYRGFACREEDRPCPEDWSDAFSLRFLHGRVMGLSVALSMINAVLVIALTWRQFSSPVVMIVATLGYSLLFVGLTAWLKSPPMAGAFAVCLTAVHPLFHFWLGPTTAAERAPLLGFAILAVTLVAGVASEWSFRGHEEEEPGRRRPAWWGAWYSYGLGFVLGGTFLLPWGERLLGQPAWGPPVALTLAVAAFAVGRAASLRWLTRAAFVYALVMAAAQVLVAVFEPLFRSSLALAGGVAFVELLVLERLLAGQDPMVLSRRNPKTAGRYRLVLVAAAAGTTLLALALSEALGGYWTTAGWSLLALVLMGAGFLWRERAYRRTALVVFALTILRLLVFDVAGLDLVYRMLAFLALGASMVAVSFLYSRYREQLSKWL